MTLGVTSWATSLQGRIAPQLTPRSPNKAPAQGSSPLSADLVLPDTAVTALVVPGASRSCGLQGNRMLCYFCWRYMLFLSEPCFTPRCYHVNKDISLDSHLQNGWQLQQLWIASGSLPLASREKGTWKDPSTQTALGIFIMLTKAGKRAHLQWGMARFNLNQSSMKLKNIW